ncbi:MAG: CPBP family intramembrane metalloprotease [Cytophagales bacterium]|nr:MAG: CPBP family intramembrane metalloprotease [Cytophagales bacterium]
METVTNTTPLDTTATNYPSIKQGWILILILIGWTIAVSLPLGIPMYLAKENGIDLYGIPEFLAYVLSFWLTIRYAQKRRSDKTLAFGVVPVAVYPIAAVGMLAIGVLAEPLITAIPQPEWLEKAMEEMFNKKIIITAVLAAPILEEILLRGIVLDGFLKRYSPTKAIIWSAVLFGVMHLIPLQALNAFFLGLAMGWVYYRTCSLWPVILMHFVNNALSSLSFLSDDSSIDISANTTRQLIGNDTTYGLILAACVFVLWGCYVLINRLTPHRIATRSV